MTLSAIAAVASNRVIGSANDLVWHLPEDLKFFKRSTLNHHILMGRKTYESMNGPLPRRTNVVITRNASYAVPEGVFVVDSLQAAIDLAREQGDEEPFVCGGGEIYRQSMDLLDKLYYTHVNAEYQGDTTFPEVDWSQWREIERTDFDVDERHPVSFSTVIYERIR